MNLLDNVKITRLDHSTAHGDDEIDTAGVDMAGFDGVMLVVALGSTVDENVVVTLTAEQSENDSSYAATVATKAITGKADPYDVEKLLVLDVYKPLERYIRANVTFATQDAEIDGIFAIQYGAHNRPVTQSTSDYDDGTTPAGVVGSATFASPAEA